MFVVFLDGRVIFGVVVVDREVVAVASVTGAAEVGFVLVKLTIVVSAVSAGVVIFD